MKKPIASRCSVRARFRFSIRLLLLLTAAMAAATAIGVKWYREQVVDRRPMQFIHAVQDGNLAEVDRLLKLDPRLAQGRQHGGMSSSHTPLQLALVFGRNPQVVARILEEKPDLDETSEAGKTALHLAIEHQLSIEVARLLQLGANPNGVDHDGNTPLRLAAQVDDSGHIVNQLLQFGADPNHLDPSRPRPDDKTPLHITAESGNTAAAVHLLAAGAQVNAPDGAGRTPLHYAALRHDVRLAKLLIDAGADLAAKDHAGQIPGQLGDGENSEIAAILWWERIVQLHDRNKISELDELLDAAPQALSFRTDYPPATVLHRAVAHRRLDVLEYLLKRMDPDARDMRGQTPLHAASLFHDVEFAERLIAAGADLEARDHAGRTPLHASASGHNHDVLKLLIAEGADFTAEYSNGTKALDAAFEGSFHHEAGLQTLALLRQAGHPPTVLYAAATGDLNYLRQIAINQRQALDRAYTPGGVRPLHAAVLGKQPEVVEWLLEQGVDRDPVGPAQMSARVSTPLHLALGYHSTKMAVLLAERGADVNRQSFSGHYPVHAAIAWDRDPVILEALLAHGADPLLKCEDKTAVELAIESQSEHRERYLELLGPFTASARGTTARDAR